MDQRIGYCTHLPEIMLGTTQVAYFEAIVIWANFLMDMLLHPVTLAQTSSNSGC